MIFIKGEKIDLEINNHDRIQTLMLLNNPNNTIWSQLGRFPVEQAYENDSNNLILTITEPNEKYVDGFSIVGRVSLENINWINCITELKIFINPNYRGKGYAKEACELIIKHGFEQLNLQRIECGTFEKNIGMIKLAESLDFKREGFRRNALYKNGEYQNIIEFGLLKEEFYNAIKKR